MRRLPLGLLQGFVLVARSGKLARAAEQLNLTVSALSHQMRNLEERVGRTLFERGPRGVTLTRDGVQLLDAVGTTSTASNTRSPGTPTGRRTC